MEIFFLRQVVAGVEMDIYNNTNRLRIAEFAESS